MKFINRAQYLKQISDGFKINPICALLGPRQCGKTTLAKEFAKKFHEKVNFFDLEDPDHLFAFNNPKLILDNLEGLIVIDEIQRVSSLFPYLRTLVDKKPKIKLLILGSASNDLLNQSSESLAGRIRYIEMTPFSLGEIKDDNKLWVRGGYPKSFLATNDLKSIEWRKDYVRTFLEKDIPNLGFKLNPQKLSMFWMMLCDYHGNIFNASEIGRSLNIDHKTSSAYVDILQGTFMTRKLQPWFANISKRQIKSYKIYFRDSGIFHALLNLSSLFSISTSSKLAASWEGFALEEIIKLNKTTQNECFFWGIQSGAELDLLILKEDKKLAYEFKYSGKPVITKSMLSSIEELKLDCLTVIIPGDMEYKLDKKIRVCGLTKYIQEKK